MSVTATELIAKHCKPCEGGVPAMSAEEVHEHLAALPQWELVEGGKLIRRKYKFKNFVAAMAFLQKAGELAESEQHHPDLHLTGYKNAAIELTTHAISGLSENDFILAAKIDKLPT